MSVLWTSPLGPALILLAGGSLLLLLQRWLSVRLQQILPVVFVIVAMGAWLALRWHPAGEGSWWVWQAPLGLGTALGIQWHGAAWLTGWLAFFAALTALILPEWRSRPGFTPPAFWILFLLAGALIVITSATWSTLLTAWALLLLFSGLLAGSPPVNASRAWTFLLLAGVFLLAVPLFNGVDSVMITLDTGALNFQAQLLLVLAAAIMLAVYPFHLWLSPKEKRWSGAQLALHLIPGLAAFHLLTRFPLPLLGSLSWVALIIAGLLGSAIAAWAAEDDDRVWIFVMINRATWIMLAFSLSRGPIAGRSLFPLAFIAIALMIWTLFRAMLKHSEERSPNRTQVRWLRLLTLIFLVGFPFTPGFPLNLNLAQLGSTLLGVPGWILTLLAQTLLVAAILRPASKPDSNPTQTLTDYLPSRRLTWMLALVTAFGLWWGIFPSALARTAGLPPSGMYSSAFAQIRSADIISWLTLLLPLLLGWLLARGRNRIFAGLESWQNRIAKIASLGWLNNLFVTGFHYLAGAVGFVGDILDGAGQFGWVLLALLIFWLFFR